MQQAAPALPWRTLLRRNTECYWSYSARGLPMTATVPDARRVLRWRPGRMMGRSLFFEANPVNVVDIDENFTLSEY